MTHVRTLVPGERWPSELATGFEALPAELIDSEWVYVAEEAGRVVAVLILARAHGLVLILRLCALSDAPKSVVWQLLSKARKECLEKGCYMFLTAVNPTGTETEREIVRAVRRWGGYQLTTPMVLLTGTMTKEKMPCLPYSDF